MPAIDVLRLNHSMTFLPMPALSDGRIAHRGYAWQSYSTRFFKRCGGVFHYPPSALFTAHCLMFIAAFELDTISLRAVAASQKQSLF